jgi:hypothetical protein
LPAAVAWYFAPATRSDCLRAAALHGLLQYRWPWSQWVQRKNICRHAGQPHVTKRRLSSTAQGTQTEIDFDDVMEIGGLDDDGKGLCLEKRRIKKGESELTFTCASKPARAGVDPMNKLVDRGSDDNTTPVSQPTDGSSAWFEPSKAKD